MLLSLEIFQLLSSFSVFCRFLDNYLFLLEVLRLYEYRDQSQLSRYPSDRRYDSWTRLQIGREDGSHRSAEISHNGPSTLLEETPGRPRQTWLHTIEKDWPQHCMAASIRSNWRESVETATPWHAACL